MKTLLEQMFEMALKNKNVRAVKFSLEWEEFETEQKKLSMHQDVCNEEICNILI